MKKYNLWRFLFALTLGIAIGIIIGFQFSGSDIEIGMIKIKGKNNTQTIEINNK